MSDLVFYTNPMSRGRIVRWMLEEVGQPYRTELLDYATTMKAPAYLAINPMGKVPAIVHRGHAVTECAAICAYLADAFPEAGLAPAPAERARYYRFLFMAAGPLEQAVVNQALGVQVPDERRGMVGYGSLPAILDAFDKEIGERPFIASDRFTAADVYVGSHLAWGMQFGTIPKRASFERYVGGLVTRPAAVRAREIDDALLPKRG